jgi:3-dehydroquinate synthase
MKAFQVRGRSGTSTVLVGETLESIGNYAPLEKTVIITDTGILCHYQEKLPPCHVIEIGTGEKAKTLETVKTICLRLMEIGADRSSFMVGIGGGVVSDIAGFVASIYLRGVRFGFVSTTLLSQVDAGIGGKNGVNLAGYKNMVGVFNQPQFVICDLNLLKTLPRKELLSGFAEIAKHAVIAEAKLFSYLEANYERGLFLDPEVIERLVCDSVAIKSSIVTRDEQEGGERRLLNFGHTFGHAVEKVAGISHGEAVSIGMAIASRLSNIRGYLALEEVDRIEALLTKLGLPIRSHCAPEALLDAMRKDKKRNGNRIHVVLLRAVGRAFVEEMPIHELRDAIRGCALPFGQ